MKTGLGYAILLITVLIALVRNPRFAVFGMVACDTIRPGDEFIEFGMETVRFSITYYAVALGLLLIFYKRYRLTTDRFHWAILLLFMSVVNSRGKSKNTTPHLWLASSDLFGLVRQAHMVFPI